MADVLASEASAERHAGSSPVLGTGINRSTGHGFLSISSPARIVGDRMILAVIPHGWSGLRVSGWYPCRSGGGHLGVSGRPPVSSLLSDRVRAFEALLSGFDSCQGRHASVAQWWVPGFYPVLCGFDSCRKHPKKGVSGVHRDWHVACHHHHHSSYPSVLVFASVMEERSSCKRPTPVRVWSLAPCPYS